jgi:mRNA surveillance protein pelota
MEIIKENRKDGIFTLRINSLEDLWYLEKAIEENDIVKGKTERKIKINEKKVIKKTFTLEIIVEKIEVRDSEMRVLGKTLNENEYIPKGAHQTIELILNTIFTLKKKKTSNYLSKLLREAKEKSKKFVFVIFDREEAKFFLVKSTKIEELSEIKGKVEKKDFKTEKENFYKKIKELSESIKQEKKADQIVYGCPAFFTEELKKEGAKGMFFPISEVSKRAINNIIKSKEFSSLVSNFRVGEEIKLLDEFLKEVHKEGLVDYGKNNIKNASKNGAIKTIIAGEDFFKENRELIDEIDKNAGNVVIANDEEVIKTLSNFGGAVVFLRYKV